MDKNGKNLAYRNWPRYHHVLFLSPPVSDRASYLPHPGVHHTSHSGHTLYLSRSCDVDGSTLRQAQAVEGGG